MKLASLVGSFIERIIPLLRAVAQAVLLLLICAGLAELSFRVYHYFSPSYIFKTNSYHRFRPKPFMYLWNSRFNSKGYLDTEFKAEKGDTYRILGIGDSFTRGAVPYEHNFLTLLESQLKQGNPRIEVLNLGIAGTGPKEYLAQLMEEGLGLAPDLVLLSFFTGNDFMEVRRDFTHKEPSSYLVSFIRFLLKIRPRYLAEMVRFCDDCPTFDHDGYLAIEGDRSGIYRKDDADFRKLCEEAVDYLIRIRDLCRERGSQFVVAVVPDELQINPVLKRQLQKQLSIPEAGWDLSLPNTMLVGRLTEAGINVIDLFGYFEEESRHQRLYRPRNTHWNIAGNQLAADVLEDYLSEYLKVSSLESANPSQFFGKSVSD